LGATSRLERGLDIGADTNDVETPIINLIADPGKTIKIIIAINVSPNGLNVYRATNLVSSVGINEQTTQRVSSNDWSILPIYRDDGFDKPLIIYVRKFTPTDRQLVIGSRESTLIEPVSIEIYKGTA
jgi:hypothetical protein